mmetsp:Transcript_21607/g.67712  ORF Transcript_21607/g.67712 Transcript_21607/m.67712 type:complete len:133 (-) Transcript_21607:255-653(-)
MANEMQYEADSLPGSTRSQNALPTQAPGALVQLPTGVPHVLVVPQKLWPPCVHAMHCDMNRIFSEDVRSRLGVVVVTVMVVAVVVVAVVVVLLVVVRVVVPVVVAVEVTVVVWVTVVAVSVRVVVSGQPRPT